MQTILTYLALFFTGILANAQNTIEVSIQDLDNNKGVVRVGLYNSENTFLNKTYTGTFSEIEAQQVTVTFTNIPDGTYAISSFHDEDNDGKLKMRMGIIPAEDYACSNNAKGFFGPPKWEDARFELKNNQVKKLTLKM